MGRKRRCVSDDIEVEILRQLSACDTGMADADEDALFGQSIAATLRKMESQNKAFSKIKLQQVLYEQQFQNISGSQPSTGYSSSSVPTIPTLQQSLPTLSFIFYFLPIQHAVS